MSQTPGKRFYERHIGFLERGDVDGLIVNQYNEDAVLIGFNGTIRGHEALHAFFKRYLDSIGGKLLVKSTDKFAETEDSIFFEATMLTPDSEVRVYDVFMLRDDRITHHFPGVLSVTPLNSAK